MSGRSVHHQLRLADAACCSSSCASSVREDARPWAKLQRLEHLGLGDLVALPSTMTIALRLTRNDEVEVALVELARSVGFTDQLAVHTRDPHGRDRPEEGTSPRW